MTGPSRSIVNVKDLQKAYNVNDYSDERLYWHNNGKYVIIYNMNSEIIAYRDKKIAIMKDDPLELNHYVTSDKARAEDYAGREILELLQNAIDVGEKVKIALTGNTLIISNSGEPFGTNNIKALMIPDNSTKADSDETIGCKGVGFRAALNISDDIAIYSGNIHIRFSESVAKKIKQQYNLEQTPPMMRCPEETTDYYSNEYTTNIVIKIRDNEQVERIRNQIGNLNKESILFFNDTFRSLETVIDDEHHAYSRKRDALNSSEAMVTINYDGESVTLKEFYEEGKLDNDNTRNSKYRLSVIYSPDPIEHNKLFSFFHTDIDFPMHHWFAHGTFNLTNNRNQLVKNTRNRILMEKLINLICDSAPKISSKIDYTGYKILRAHDYFSDTILEDTDLNSILNNSIDKALIMPTVHNRYISLGDQPVFYDLNFQKYLIDMPGNDSLLQFTNDEEVVRFLKQDINCTYKLGFISDYLSGYTFSSNDDRVICAKLLHKYYGEDIDFAIKAPNFFLDNNGNEIDNGSILIESDASSNLTLPPFIKLKYVNNELLDIAKKYLCSRDDTDFVYSDFAKSYGFKIADINEILEKIDEYIKDHEDFIPIYVRWLFDNRDALDNVYFGKYYLLTKNNEARRSNSLYFGRDYIKGTQLEKFYDSSKIVAKPSLFNIKPEEIEDFKHFLKETLEVADYPRNKEGSIDGLERILKVGSTKYIIGLILQNQNFLNSYKNISSARNNFRNEKWIVKKGKRYSPSEVILTSRHNYHKISNYLNDNFLFISQDDLLSGIQMEKSARIWLIEEYLCFKNELYELDNKYIYQILNELPTFDPRGEISEDVYKDIIVNNNDREKPDLELLEFREFINSGKVFCLDRSYHNVKDCLYLKEKYPKIIESDYHFINIVKNKSSDAIRDRFRIDTLSVNYALHDFKKSQSNTIDFKSDINNFKTSILAENSDRFKEDNDLKELQDISIVLCDSISIEYTERIGALEDYEYVKDGSDFYIKIPQKPFSTLKNNDKFQDALSDIFRTIYSYLDKDGTARAIGRDINSRIEKVKNEFGNNAWSEAETKLNLILQSNIDYSSENAEILNNLRDKYFKEYKYRLYSKLQNSSIEEKSTYVDELNSYKDHVFDINDIPSEKDSNMLDYLFGVFPILCEKIVVAENIESYRIEAYSHLCDEFSEYVDILKQLLDDNRFESLLRFNETKLIRSEMRNLISRLQNKDLEKRNNSVDEDGENDTNTNNDTNDKTSSILGSTTKNKEGFTNTKNDSENNSKKSNSSKSIHFDYKKITTTSLQQANFVAFEEVKPRAKHSEQRNISSTRRMSTAARKAQEDRAKKAEKIALEELERQGYANILWVSAYAKDEGVNPDGADGYGYDIQCEKDGEVRYIEVKSSLSSTGIEFEMSENELKFCSQHADNYDIVYVYGMNLESSKITIIEKVFYEINDSNKSPASYKIRLK